MAENLTDWLSVVVPEATTNLLRNPSFEESTSGWATTNATLTRVIGGRYGFWAGRVLASAQNGGIANDALQSITTDGGPITLSGMLKTAASAGQIEVRLDNGSTVYGTVTNGAPDADGWYWFELTVTPPAAQPLIVRTRDTRSSSWTEVLFDGLMVERKAYATTYCDGDQDGCTWATREHFSQSSRSATTRLGGRVRTFRELGVHTVRTIAGAGLPVVTNNATPYAVLDGSDFGGTTIPSQAITMVCVLDSVSVAAFHTLRALLISTLFWRRNEEPMLLRYRPAGGTRTLQLRVRYEGGLELTETTAASEFVPLRLIAHDPSWEDLYETAVSLETFKAHSSSKPLARRLPDGTWDALGTVSGDSITGIKLIAVAPNGTIYVHGTFTSIGGVAANNIAYYDGEWHAMGTGATADSINSIAFGLNGDVWVGGNFTSIGGVALNYVAKWSAGAWSGLTGAGLNTINAVVRAVAVRPIDGALLIGGDFTAPYPRLAIQDVDGVNISEGTGPNSGGIYGITFLPNSDAILVGSFTAFTTPSMTSNYAAKFLSFIPSGSTTAWRTFGLASTGASNLLNGVAVSKTGVVYASGNISTLGRIGLYYNDGSGWQASAGVSTTVISSAVTHLGVVMGPDDRPYYLMSQSMVYDRASPESVSQPYVWPTVSSTNVLFFQNVVRFNGSGASLPLSMGFVTTTAVGTNKAYVQALAFDRNGEPIVGSPQSLAAFRYAEPLSITVRTRTPVRVLATGTNCEFTAIINHSSGKEILFKKADLPAAGTLKIDTQHGKESVLIGNAINGNSRVTAESTLATFWLEQGQNMIAAFTPPKRNTVASSVTSDGAVALAYRPRYQTLDDVA